MKSCNSPYQVAVIIPTLNEEKFIMSCLQSVLAQSFPLEEMDILIVDGGSTDSTCKLVTQLCNQYQNIRLLHNEKRIQSIAFNIGVANSSAPYIIRLDAHATYDTNYIHLCLQHLKEHPEFGNVGGICDIQPQNSSLIAQASAVLNKSKFGTGGASFRVGTKEGEVDTVPFGAFPRSVVNEIGGMNEHLGRGEDNEYNNRVRKAGYKIFLDPHIISHYYSRPTWIACIMQMYKNGLSIGLLLHIDSSSVSIRHLIPMLFVLCLIAGIIGAPLSPFILSLLVSMLGIYILISLTATFILCQKYGYKYFFILPPLFLSVHIMYGVGTIIGLITNNN